MRRELKKLYQLLFIIALLITLVAQASYALSEQNNSSDQTTGITEALEPDTISSTAPAGEVRDIPIQLNNTNNWPVRFTTVKVEDNVTPPIYLFTDENGLTSFQGKQNETYLFTINTNGYENISQYITILPGLDKIKFTLKPQQGQNIYDFWPFFLPATFGFVAFIFWYFRFYTDRSILSWVKGTHLSYIYIPLLILSWPIIIIYLIWIYDIDYISLPDIITLSNVSFPVFISVFALAGVISYLLLSIGETFSQTIPNFKKKSIIWGYVRRVVIAPYISILGAYILLDAAKVQNIWFIYGFSFFTGIYTKTIEEWLYKSIQGLLPQNLRDEVNERVNYNIENSELAMRLHMDQDIAFFLYKSGIRTVDQLASFKDAEDLNKFLKHVKAGELHGPDPYLDEVIKNAKKQRHEFNDFINNFKFTTRELDLIVKNKIYSKNDFVNFDISSIEGIGPSEKSSLIKKQGEANNNAPPANAQPANAPPANAQPANPPTVTKSDNR